MKLTVVKCGGAALTHGPFVLERYVSRGEGVCVVHGAGARITAALEAAGIESRFVGGRRETSSAALPLVREAYRFENGRLAYPVEEVTVAGNLLEMFAAVDGVADDLVLRDRTASPTLKIARMVVAGN